MTWWTDYQARRGQDRKTLFTDNMKNLVSTEFENSTSYELVKISGVDRKTRIVEESSIIKNPNRKRLLCFPDETISIGEIVEFDNSNWICVNGDTTSKISDVGIIERCNNNVLKFYDSSSTLHFIPCIISKGSISLDEQKIISTLDSEIAIQISNTSITRQIEMNDVFKIGLRNYSVTDINDITVNGLLLIKMVYSEVEQVIPTHNYSIDILNGISASITQNETLQLNVSITDNSIEISPTPIISYVSSDESVCTVDSSGLVTAINSEGNCTIIVTYQNVSDSIELLVVTEIQHNYTVNIVPSGILKVGQTITAVAQFMDNGVVTGDIATQWKLFADDGVSTTTLATITPLGNNCSIKAGTSIGYVRLYVENENCSNVVRVQVASLW